MRLSFDQFKDQIGGRRVELVNPNPPKDGLGDSP